MGMRGARAPGRRSLLGWSLACGDRGDGGRAGGARPSPAPGRHRAHRVPRRGAARLMGGRGPRRTPDREPHWTLRRGPPRLTSGRGPPRRAPGRRPHRTSGHSPPCAAPVRGCGCRSGRGRACGARRHRRACGPNLTLSPPCSGPTGAPPWAGMDIDRPHRTTRARAAPEARIDDGPGGSDGEGVSPRPGRVGGRSGRAAIGRSPVQRTGGRPETGRRRGGPVPRARHRCGRSAAAARR